MARSARRWRENIRFFAGLGGLAFEMVVEHSDRPVLLAIFAGMIGLDVLSNTILRDDE